MAGTDKRVVVNMACGDCKSRNYTTKKNKQNDQNRLELNKHCPRCGKHTMHREAK
jgi:large subunit ribosomal protein L33